MISKVIKKSHVIAVCVVVSTVFCCSCKIRGFKDKPYRTPWVIVDTPAGIQSGDITLTYRLIEVDGSGADISLQYSTDGGANWQAATAKGGDGTTDITGVRYPGVNRTIVWDTVADAVGGLQTCNVKVVAAKSGSGTVGTPGVTDDFQVDNPAIPAISWLSRPEGTVRQVQLTFVWQLDTPAVPIADYYYGLDEDPPTSTTANTSVTIPAPAPGAHTLRVFAQSTLGFNSSVLSATFTCDNAVSNSPPAVDITSGPSGTINQNFAAFTWQGYDVDGSVVSYEYDFDCSGWIDAGLVTSELFTGLMNGSYSFLVRAKDNEGAYSLSATRSFTYQPSGPNQPPTVIVTGGPTGATLDNTPTFTWQGHDTDGTVIGYYISIDQNPPTIWTTNTNWTSPELPGGSHTFYVIAQDDRGANSSVVPHGFVIMDVVGTIFVDGVSGDNANDGLSWATAVRTIRRGIELAGSTGWLVLVADGCYTGKGNRNIGLRGKDVYLKSSGSADTCIINCDERGRGFDVTSNETPAAVIDGFTITNARIVDTGAAIYTETGVTIRNCRFIENLAVYNGGAITCGTDSYSTIENCTFINNAANWAGGAIRCKGSQAIKIINCEFRNNEAGRATLFGDYPGGAILTETVDSISILNCVFSGNFASAGGGAIRISSATVATIGNCYFNGNVADAGGAISLSWVDATIYDTVIINNTARDWKGGGGIYFDEASSTRAWNLLIANNTAWETGGGFTVTDKIAVTIYQSAIVDNFAPTGGGAHIHGNATLINSIIWNNDASLSGKQINIHFQAQWVELFYCNYADNALDPKNVEGKPVFSPNYCTNLDPEFLYPSTNNYRLKESSPCINLGSTTLVPLEVVTDLDGNPRILEDEVDIGPYELVNNPGNEIPGITITEGPSGNVFGNVHTFDYVGYDTDGTVTGYFVSVDTYPPDIWTTQNSWTSPAISYGQHTFYVMARDNSGANSSAISRSYLAMSARPTIRITTAPAGSTTDNTPTFTYIGNDPDGVVAGYYVSMDQTPPVTWTANTNWTSHELDQGFHTFYVSAQDNTGTKSEIASIEFLLFDVSRIVYVDGSLGDNANDGSSWPQAVKTIQKGIDLANTSGTMVLIADGTYTGNGNKEINFFEKNIYLRSVGGAGSCIIDCQGNGNAIDIKNVNNTLVIIDGIKIINAYDPAESGGGISLWPKWGVMDFAVTNCIFDNNFAERGGGVHCGDLEMKTLISNCSFTNNSTNGVGGAYFCAGKTVFYNCDFIGNVAGLSGNPDIDGGAIHSQTKVATVIDNCTFLNNVANDCGGAVWIEDQDYGYITNCHFDNNVAEHGGAFSIGSRIVKIHNTDIVNNRSIATGHGGGCDVWAQFRAELVNVLIANNSATSTGGGIWLNSAECHMYQCTIANNSAVRGGGIDNTYYLFIHNSIIWNNYASSSAKQLDTNTMDIIFDHCCYADNSLDPDNIGGGGTLYNTNCIHLDPLFVNAAVNNFRLSPGSPCIDTGNNVRVPFECTKDLDGNPRIVDGVAPWDGPKVDIGAYEYQP